MCSKKGQVNLLRKVKRVPAGILSKGSGWWMEGAVMYCTDGGVKPFLAVPKTTNLPLTPCIYNPELVQRYIDNSEKRPMNILKQTPARRAIYYCIGNTIISKISRKTFMTSAETVHRMIDNLPPDLRSEAIHYIEELAKRKKKPGKKKFQLTWAGGLSHLNKTTTAVELQHAAREWRD